MDIDLRPQDPQPLYLQLVEQLRRQIVLGVLAPGAKLPTVRELAVLARVNRNTAARAIQALESASLVYTRVGRGTFVAENASEAGTAAVDQALEQLLDRLIAESLELGADLQQLPERLRDRIECAASPDRQEQPGKSTTSKPADASSKEEPR